METLKEEIDKIGCGRIKNQLFIKKSNKHTKKMKKVDKKYTITYKNCNKVTE